MIKVKFYKTIIILILLCIVYAPTALANDGGIRPDTQRLTFTYKPISSDIEIGEVFEFELTITNHTAGDIKIIGFEGIFNDTSSGFVDIDDNIIDPYSTKTVKVSYLIRGSINWYELNGEYYVDLHPTLCYLAKEKTDDKPLDFDGVYDSDDYWDFYQQGKQTYRLKIANLEDGSELANISIMDDKNIIGFNDSAYKVSSSWNGELKCEHVSYLKVENLCGEPIEKLSVYQDYNTFNVVFEQTLDIEEHITFKHVHESYLLEKDIPKKIDMDFRAIFNLDGQYYCIYTNRVYDTKVYDVPEIKVKIRTVYDKMSYDRRPMYVLSFENINRETLKNFCIMYSIPFASLKSSYDMYGEYTMYGDFAYGDVWDFPLAFSSVNEVEFYIGYMEENTFYTKVCEVSSSGYNEKDIESIEYIFRDAETDLYQIILDVYDLYNEIEITFSRQYADVETPAPTDTPNPTDKPTQTPSPAPTIEPTEKDMQDLLSTIAVEEKNTYYIPTWVWIALVIAGLLIVALVIYTTIKNNENR